MSYDLLLSQFPSILPAVARKSWARDSSPRAPAAAVAPPAPKLVPTAEEQARVERLATLRARAESGDKRARKEWGKAISQVKVLRARARGGDPRATRACQVLEASGLLGKSVKVSVSGVASRKTYLAEKSARSGQPAVLVLEPVVELVNPTMTLSSDQGLQNFRLLRLLQGDKKVFTGPPTLANTGKTITLEGSVSRSRPAKLLFDYSGPGEGTLRARLETSTVSGREEIGRMFARDSRCQYFSGRGDSLGDLVGLTADWTLPKRPVTEAARQELTEAIMNIDVKAKALAPDLEVPGRPNEWSPDASYANQKRALAGDKRALQVAAYGSAVKLLEDARGGVQYTNASPLDSQVLNDFLKSSRGDKGSLERIKRNQELSLKGNNLDAFRYTATVQGLKIAFDLVHKRPHAREAVKQQLLSSRMTTSDASGREESCGREEILGDFVGDEERLAHDAGPAERASAARISGAAPWGRRSRGKSRARHLRKLVWRASRGDAAASAKVQAISARLQQRSSAGDARATALLQKIQAMQARAQAISTQPGATPAAAPAYAPPPPPVPAPVANVTYAAPYASDVDPEYDE